MNPIPSYSKNATLVVYGSKIKMSDIRHCLLKLTDLSGALHSFSIRVIINERPRNKLIIDVEMASGFDPARYNEHSYVYEFLSHVKKLQRGFRDFLRNIPAEYFPELYFHAFNQVQFDTSRFRTKCTYHF